MTCIRLEIVNSRLLDLKFERAICCMRSREDNAPSSFSLDRVKSFATESGNPASTGSGSSGTWLQTRFELLAGLPDEPTSIDLRSISTREGFR